MTKTEYKVIQGGKSATGGDGSGPEDPMYEARINRLENVLASLEPKISEILQTGAKQSDIHKIELRSSESARQTDLTAARVDLAEIKGRIATLPTWWMLLVAMITTWGAGTGIVFALLRFAPR